MIELRRRIILTPEDIAAVLGVIDGGAVVDSWLNGVSPIPYACWGVLCEMAGLGLIWRAEKRKWP